MSKTDIDLTGYYRLSPQWGASTIDDGIPRKPPTFTHKSSYKRFENTFEEIMEKIATAGKMDTLVPTLFLHKDFNSEIILPNETIDLQLIVIDIDIDEADWAYHTDVSTILKLAQGFEHAHVEYSRSHRLHIVGYVNPQIAPSTKIRKRYLEGNIEILVNGACMITSNFHPISTGSVGRIDPILDYLQNVVLPTPITPNIPKKEIAQDYKEEFLEYLRYHTIPLALTRTRPLEFNEEILPVPLKEVKEAALENTDSQFDYIAELLKSFPDYDSDSALYDDYDLWFAVGSHIHHHIDTDEGLELFLEYSRHSPKFNEADVKDQWLKFDSDYRTHDLLKNHLPQIKFKNKRSVDVWFLTNFKRFTEVAHQLQNYETLASFLKWADQHEVLSKYFPPNVYTYLEEYAWDIFLAAGHPFPIHKQELPSDPLILKTAEYALSTMRVPNVHLAINYSVALFNGLSPKGINLNGSANCVYYVFYGSTSSGKTSSFKFFNEVLSLTIPEHYINNAPMKTSEGLYHLLNIKKGRIFLFIDEIATFLQEGSTTSKTSNAAMSYLLDILKRAYTRDTLSKNISVKALQDNDLDDQIVHPLITLISFMTKDQLSALLRDSSFTSDGLFNRITFIDIESGNFGSRVNYNVNVKAVAGEYFNKYLAPFLTLEMPPDDMEVSEVSEVYEDSEAENKEESVSYLSKLNDSDNYVAFELERKAEQLHFEIDQLKENDLMPYEDDGDLFTSSHSLFFRHTDRLRQASLQTVFFNETLHDEMNKLVTYDIFSSWHRYFKRHVYDLSTLASEQSQFSGRTAKYNLINNLLTTMVAKDRFGYKPENRTYLKYRIYVDDKIIPYTLIKNKFKKEISEDHLKGFLKQAVKLNHMLTVKKGKFKGYIYNDNSTIKLALDNKFEVDS